MTAYNKIIVVIACVFTQAIFSQSLTEIQKLESTGRIWGFLKYYHPSAASGNYNWDEELITLLPKVKQAQTKEELNLLYITWIDKLGNIKPCKACSKKPSDSFDKNFSMAWMENDIVFTPELTQKLKYIESNRLLGDKYYIKNGGVGNAAMNNEPVYENFDYPEESYRLLTLFRYWNFIEYFFPYKYLMDENWGNVLSKAIPQFTNAANAQQYHLAILELVAKTNDSHSYFVTKYTNEYFGFYWAPFKFKIIENKAIVTGFYDEAKAQGNDIRIGDIITKVDGVGIGEKLNIQKKYLPTSNPSTLGRDAYYAIFNSSNDKISITFIRDGVTSEKVIQKYLNKDFKGPEVPVEKYKMLKGNIGYVNMGHIESADVNGMFDEFSGTKAIIFDVRNYPKGVFPDIANHLYAREQDFAKFTKPDLDYPGKFIWQEGYKVGMKNKNPYKGKVILLFNEESQSHAEFTIMALERGENTVKIGSQTAGADGNVVTLEHPGGYKTWMTGIGVYYPDGTETQRIGIVPDIEVKPTIEGIKAGKDEVLEKAIEVANQ